MSERLNFTDDVLAGAAIGHDYFDGDASLTETPTVNGMSSRSERDPNRQNGYFETRLQPELVEIDYTV